MAAPGPARVMGMHQAYAAAAAIEYTVNYTPLGPSPRGWLQAQPLLYLLRLRDRLPEAKVSSNSSSKMADRLTPACASSVSSLLYLRT